MASSITQMRDAALAAVAILVPVAFLVMSPAALADDVPAHVDTSRQNLQPPYPDTAQANGEQGNVVVAVRVAASGAIRNIYVAGSSGFPDLDNAAVEGVLRWHFIPAVQDGDTASSWTKVNIVYQLPKASISPPANSPPEPGGAR